MVHSRSVYSRTSAGVTPSVAAAAPDGGALEGAVHPSAATNAADVNANMPRPIPIAVICTSPWRGS
jgi:hypothetical protein